MRAAIDPAALLDAMSNDAALAMGASRRQRGDRAFETVERQGLSLRQDLETLVVVVAAYIAYRHFCDPFPRLVRYRRVLAGCRPNSWRSWSCARHAPSSLHPRS